MSTVLQEKKSNGSAGNGTESIKLVQNSKKTGLFKWAGRQVASSMNIIEVLPLPVVLIDRDFNIQFANAAGTEIMAGTKESCIGQKCFEKFRFPSCNTPNCQVARVFTDGNPLSGEVVIKLTRGECLYRCYTAPVKDENGQIIGALEYFVDASREQGYVTDIENCCSDIGLGKTDARVDVNKYDGVLCEAAKRINKVLNGLIALFNAHQGYFEKIGRGERNLTHWVATRGDANGSWKKSAESFNVTIDAINNLTAEVESLTKAAIEGQLNVRGDVSKFQGAWADMLSGINSLLDAIVYPVNEVSDVLNKLAQGDLTGRVMVECKGDLLKMKESTNQAVANNVKAITNLRDVARLLNESAENLSKASGQAGQATGQIANATQQVAKGAADQATSMQETMKALDQLARAIDQIAKGAQEQAKMMEKNVMMVSQISSAINEVYNNAEHATESASVASATADNGVEMVRKTIKGMEVIKNTIDAASEKMSGLGNRSSEIGKIVATINDIADQTNLLALNAAIEAARAGEQGRGFAVVADEVRKLAERSSVSTKEIAELISGIQAGVSDTMAAMEKGTDQVANGYELATRAGVSLEEILIKSREMGEKVIKISSATQELTNTSTEMVKLSDSISAVVEENTAATEEMSATAKQVAKSIESIAGIAEQNSAATQEVSASAEEISAQMQQVADSSKTMLTVAEQFKNQLANQKI